MTILLLSICRTTAEKIPAVIAGVALDALTLYGIVDVMKAWIDV